MNISFYKLFTLVSVFSTKIAASELPSSGRVIKSDSKSCSRFAQDLIRKKSCVGTCTGEEDTTALRNIRGAECLFCLGIGCCATAGYGAITCAADPTSAFVLGSTGGCGGGIAFTMISNNNPHCGLYQAKSSLTAKAEEEKIAKTFKKLFPQLIQQHMEIAPSPIESQENPILK
jgi:hypothetical protein